MQRRSGWKMKCSLLAFWVICLAGCSQNIATVPPASPSPTLPTPGWTPVTLVPEALPSNTPSQPTPIPFAYETPTPVFTPAPGADAYRLVDWSEERALALVKSAEQFSFANNIPMPVGEKRFNYQIDQSVVRLAAVEALYRFPDSVHQKELAWRVALADTIMDSPESDAWILRAVEDALNQGEFTTQTLDQNLGQYGFKTGQWQTVPNLFADGQPAQVFWITRIDQGTTGLYAALRRNSQGEYSLSKIYSSWNFNFGIDEPLRIEEHTGEGIPEVILSPGYVNGSFCGYELVILQWKTDRFVDLSQGQFAFDTCSLYPEGWAYVDSPDLTGKSIETRRAVDAVAKVIRHERFDWHGEQYELKESWLETPEKFDRAASSWLLHAMHAGDYPTVIQKIEDLLQNQHQVEVIKLEFGGSYPDYLQFQRGLAYAFQSREAEARAVFEELAHNPHNPASRTISNAAQAYLDQYRGEADLYRACQSALQVMAAALGEHSLLADPVLAERMEQAWGYLPDSSWDSLALCSLSTAFPPAAARLDATQFSQAPEILQDAGVIVRAAQESDLDGNGQGEWVLTVDTPGSDAPVDIWILLNTKKGVRAVPLVAWMRKRNDLPANAFAATRLDVTTIVSPEGKTIALVHAGDRLYAFELNTAEESITRVLWETSSVEKYNLENQGNSLQLEVTVTTDNCPHCLDVYLWSDGSFNWTLPDEPNKVERLAAERTLLNLWKPGEAIPLLQGVIDHHPSPRLLYLLGLAYELQNDDPNAIQTYWNIWHNYPESAYARLAQAKLELKK